MTLSSDITALAQRAGQECRSLRLLINGNVAGLTGLNTTNKTTLVAAINEVYATVTAGVGDATTSVKGIVMLATNAEAQTGTDAAKVVTPASLAAAIAGKANTSALAAIALSGSASDLITGTIPIAVLPPLAINDTFAPADQTAMLALTAQRGDIAIRQDTGITFVLAAEPATVLANWKEILSAGKVVSVAGRTGAVVLTKADVGLTNVDNTADTAKPLSTAATTALAGKEATITAGSTAQYWRGDKSWQTLDKTSVGLANVDNTSDANKPTSAITQTALNGKVSLALMETITGAKTFSVAPVVPDASFTIAKTTGLQAAIDGKAAVGHTHTLSDLPDAWVKRSVRVATTVDITLSGTQTVDGIALVAGDRVLVKNQASAANNGIYIVAAGAWSRATDASVSAYLSGADVVVDAGGQAGTHWTTTFAAGSTLGTSTMPWYQAADTSMVYTKAEIGSVVNNFVTDFNTALV